MCIFDWHDRIITFLSDGGMSETDDGYESIISSSTSAVHLRKRYSVEQKAVLRKTLGTLAKKLSLQRQKFTHIYI